MGTDLCLLPRAALFETREQRPGAGSLDRLMNVQGDGALQSEDWRTAHPVKLILLEFIDTGEWGKRKRGDNSVWNS